MLRNKEKPRKKSRECRRKEKSSLNKLNSNKTKRSKKKSRSKSRSVNKSLSREKLKL